MDYPETKPAPDASEGMSDGEMLSALQGEMRRAIGFENDKELTDSRERALLYLKGDMTKDIPSLPNRSKAVSSDIADAVETALPDLMEILTNGDDVVAFIPTGLDDEDQAQQETDYLTHVVWQDNPGFLNFYTFLKDALLLKIGVFQFGWKEEINSTEEKFTGKSAAEVQLAAQDGEIADVSADSEPEEGADLRTAPEPTYSFTLKKKKDLSRAEYHAFPPDDFSAAADTIRIADTTYCVLRERPRVQDLIAEGFDPEAVRALQPYVDDNTIVQQARDTAGEHTESGTSSDAPDDLRQVETRKHYIRLLGEDDKLHIWCVVTDSEATKVLKKKGKGRWEEPRIPFAVASPYIVAHRMYGESLADKLFEIARIKTVLTRTMLDSAYFAINQRYEVSDAGKNDYTISDLLNNVPGGPVRSKTGEAVRALNAAQIPFDGYAALEYFSTVAEQRTGMVRNAQGLNPDTLHDTAKGAEALMSAAAKRLRMIARIFAETGIKELYLGMHAVIRENATAEVQAKFNNEWKAFNPSQWAERNNMTIEVGLGASGQQHDMMVIGQAQLMTEKLVESGTGVVTPQNLYNLADYAYKKLGIKQPERFITDPSKQPPQQPKPDPEMAKVMQDGQIAQAQMAQDAQIKSAQMQQDGQIKSAQTQADAAMQAQRLQQDGELKRYQTDQELLLKREQLAAELQLKREQLAAELELKRQGMVLQARQDAAVTSGVHVGGEPG